MKNIMVVQRALFLTLGVVGLSSLGMAIPLCPGAPAALSAIGVTDTIDGTTGILTNTATGSCLFGSNVISGVSLAGSNVANAAMSANIDSASLLIAFSQVG